MRPSAQPSSYRVPASLRDLVMIDLLTLTGSTAATAALLNTSQPTVSRRSRAVASDLGLHPQRGAPLGRFRDTPWLEMLRRGVNHHRLAQGVLRVGGDKQWQSLLINAAWAQWVPLGLRQQRHWRGLLDLELLDGVAIAYPTELSDPALSPYVVVELQQLVDAAAVLVCRPDPLVLEISRRLHP